MSKSQWMPAMFEIAMGTPGDHGLPRCESHRETVEGETWSSFGINAEDDCPCTYWFVTHLPTGYLLVSAESREAARRFCEEVAPLTDWALVQPGRIPPSIKDDVLRAWHRARGAIEVRP